MTDATDENAAAGLEIGFSEIIAEIESEIGYRRWVYQKRIADGKMKPALAARKIEIMQRLKFLAEQLCGMTSDGAVKLRSRVEQPRQGRLL